MASFIVAQVEGYRILINTLVTYNQNIIYAIVGLPRSHRRINECTGSVIVKITDFSK
jgi:hypothetical protein